MIKKLISLTLVLCVVISAFSQNGKITGKVTDSKNEALISANVIIDISKNQAVNTDYDGNYELSIPAGTYTVKYRYNGKIEKSIKITLADGETKTQNVQMEDLVNEMNTLVVTGSRMEKKLSEETVTMAVLKADVLKNNNINSLDQGMNRVPGVTIVDGQANIRGGAGWSYGAGSRVAILLDDMPITSADASDAKWSAVPTENIEQVEVIKGAASALYGSSALNGIINARTAFANAEPYTRIQVSTGFYEGPNKSSSLKKGWSKKSPVMTNFNIADRRKIGQFDLVLGAALDLDNGFLDSSESNFFRGHVKFRYRAKKVPGLNVGVNFVGYYSWGTTFFIWKGIDSFGYAPLPNSITQYNTMRLMVDPFINYTDKKNNKFMLRGRYFNSTNKNNTGQGSAPVKYYGEFQYSRTWEKINLSFVTGTVGQFDDVTPPAGDTASLVGAHKGYSAAIYAQVDKKFFKKLNVTLGTRWEYFQIDKNNSLKDLPYPVFRVGLNYEAAKATFLRFSFGQGFRYPSIAEKYVRTSVGAIGIYPNPKIESEKGYSAELGIKQGFQLKKGNWRGFLDLSAFFNSYTNMMEFTFGAYGNGLLNPNTLPGNPNASQYAGLPKDPLLGIGFASQNIGNVRIIGTEITGAIQGNAGPVGMTFMFGYTFIDPRTTSKSWDQDTLKVYDIKGNPVPIIGKEDTTYNGQSYKATSSTDQNILKYRSKHTLKLDYTVTYKKWELNANLQYSSYFENIDYAFTSSLFIAQEKSFGASSFSGLKEYRRRKEAATIKGDIILNATLAFNITPKAKVAFLVKNLLNWEYTPRPGIYGAPRNYALQLSYQF